MYILSYRFKLGRRHTQCRLFALIMFSFMVFHAPSVFAHQSLPSEGNRRAIQTPQSVRIHIQPSQQEVNFFTFTGVHTFITYTVTNAQLLYQGPQGKQAWKGKSLNVQDSLLGTLITVFFPGNPDMGMISLTILLPPIDLINSAPASFKTLAIYVHHRGFILIPSARLTYTTLALQGTAQHIT